MPSFFGFDSFGKTLMTLGIVLVIIGAVLHFGGKVLNLGKLPGDIHIERGNFTFDFPVVTSLLVSLVLTVILNLIMRR